MHTGPTPQVSVPQVKALSEGLVYCLWPRLTAPRAASKRRVVALMRSLHGAVSSDGVASKTLLTSRGLRTVRERKVCRAFRQDVVGLAS